MSKQTATKQATETTAKPDQTRVPYQSMIDVCKARPGLKYEDKAAWTKVEARANRRVYIPKQPRGVARVDVAGFEVDLKDAKFEGGVKSLGGESHGAVKQAFVFEGRTEEQVLETLGHVLDHMLTLEAAEAKRGPRPSVSAKGGKSKPEPKLDAEGKPVELAPEAKAVTDKSLTPAQKKKRLAVIREHAKKAGVRVSDKTIEVLDEAVHETDDELAAAKLSKDQAASELGMKALGGE